MERTGTRYFSAGIIEPLLNDGPERAPELEQQQVFTYDGQPVRDGQLQSKFRKIGNFRATEFMGGINLRDSLRDYLQSLRGPGR